MADRTPTRPRIAVTMGDPAGVGPEIIVKALAAPAIREICEPVVLGSPVALERAMEVLGRSLSIQVSSDLSEPADESGGVRVIPVGELTLSDMPYGRPSRAACRVVVDTIEKAARLALEGVVDAVCTAPIHKAHLHEHGFPFPGHTEFLLQLTGAPEVVMMLAGPRLRVSLVTIHHALAQVPDLLTPERIRTAIRITGEALMVDFGLDSPRVAVAALNPHAGEGGQFGDEESRIIAPAIESFRDQPYRVSGPHPPDTVFHRAYEGEFDAVVAMYHDQGLIPVKLVHFHEAVNVSLGLPIIRTSVDHGTAYDIAGTDWAHPGSLEAAIRLATLMVGNRRKKAAL